MANQLWSQTQFTKGEISPYMYARADNIAYYNGVKTAQNALCYPQGAIGKRFGTVFQAQLSNIADEFSYFFQTFTYLNECIYQLIFRDTAIDIFLEGVLIATVSGTGLDSNDCFNLDYTVIGSRFRVAGRGFHPRDLIRGANAGQAVISISPLSFATAGTPFTANKIYPIKFTVTTAPGDQIMQTTPQIKPGITYFIFAENAFTAEIYETAEEAKFRLVSGIPAGFAITSMGVGTTTAIVQNSWTFILVPFRNYPIYDFNGGYDSITFTPTAVDGNTTLTASSAIFTSAHVNGAFIGGGGIARITAVAGGTSASIFVVRRFDTTAAIPGLLSVLAEPAWSDIRGWPQKCSSYQNRAIFCNSDSLPNGFWASVINDYNDFNDLEADPDDAISWYPTSGDINYIRFIVPYRSITIHTNSGVYSSPLSDVTAITPTNFTLLLQDSTPADVLQPRAIDNQIIVVSGNDVHTLLWDGINNAYNSNIVSLTSEQLIRSPVDEAPYVDLTRAGSRYVFIINANGSMAIYQTVISEEISGWTGHIMEQSYGSAKFLQCASSNDGRAWFTTQRDIATANAPVNITGFTSSTLTAIATTFSTTIATAITFTTSGSLPVTTPQIAVNTYYWAIGVTADTFKIYATQEDAYANSNQFVVSSAGTSSQVIAWPLSSNNFFLEELSNDARLDCATYFYRGTPSTTVTGMTRFNGQTVKMTGDGFGFETVVVGGTATFEAHGETVEVSEGYIGFPINTIIEPLPLSMSAGQTVKQTTLTEPKHIRFARFMFNNTIGGTINGVPIALRSFDAIGIGEPPVPARGFVEISIMKGWDDFNNPSYTIEHNDPFNIELLGVFYTVDV